jgi:hypothetical protein
VNGPQEKLSVKPKRLSVAAALAAGKFGEAGENNPPGADEGVAPFPRSTAIPPPENREFKPIETGKEDHDTDKPTHQRNQINKGTQNDEPDGIAGTTATPSSRQIAERGRVKNASSTPRAGRLERGRSQALRRNRTFRASDAEFDILFDILEQVRRSRRLTRSQANRVETSTVIRAALRHVAKAPVDAILDEIIERDDFSGP